jgi:hypothetical protein
VPDAAGLVDDDDRCPSRESSKAIEEPMTPARHDDIRDDRS